MIRASGACKGSVTSWGVMYTPWAQLEWDEEVCVIEWCCMTGYLLLNTLPVELFIFQ